MRKPLRFRAVRDLRRPTPMRTALKPELREGRRNQRLRQFGRPEKHQSRTLRQANRLRRHWNRNPVAALKQLPRDGRSGKNRRPAILECGPSPRFPKSDIVQLGPEPKERDAAFRRRASVDYAVREKLMNFASAATEHPAFARELPRLSPKCDVCFRPTERDAEYRETDEDEFHYESPPGQPSVSGSSRRSRTSSPRIPTAPFERLEIRIPSRLSTTNPQVTLRDLHRHRTSARGGSNSWRARRADAKPLVEF
jgi:hypothetical protein